MTIRHQACIVGAHGHPTRKALVQAQARRLAVLEAAAGSLSD